MSCASHVAPYRGAVGGAGRAGGARAGLGDLPGHCIVSSDPGSSKGSCGGRRGAGERVPGWSLPLHLSNAGTSSTDLKDRGEDEDHHVAKFRSRCFGKGVVCEDRGGFGSWSPLAMLPT